MRIVLDTNVVVSAVLWQGIPNLLLNCVEEHEVDLYSSAPLLAELRDVLTRPKLQSRIASAPLSAEEIVEEYARLVTMVEPVAIPRTAPDPDDDVVIGTAVAARADLIVTGDASLRAVGSYSGIRIFTAAEAYLEISEPA